MKCNKALVSEHRKPVTEGAGPWGQEKSARRIRVTLTPGRTELAGLLVEEPKRGDHLHSLLPVSHS